ncbi:MAG: oligosaccharide flippase family protein [Lachnospiraceae bacterium]|nr:oligosaccharide flippase family protein [Lachnospiraceae bacterium]MCI8813742.1 oligosaccharide flippase family protein [Lachnospiraceae bacterium]
MRINPKQIIGNLYSEGAWHITLGTFITKFVGFFGSIFIVRILSKEDYGVLSYVENLFSYAFLLAGLGLSYAILRYEVLANTIEEKKAYHDYIVKKSFIIDVGIVAIVLLTNCFVTYPEEFASAKYWLPIVIVILPFQDLYTNEVFVIRGFFKNKLYAYVSFVTSILLIVARIIGAYKFAIGGAFWSRVILYILFGILGAVYINTAFFRSSEKTLISREKKREIDVYAVQYMLTNGLWALLMLNDTFMLGQLTKSSQALAEYKVASVLPGNISIFASAIGLFVSPYFTRHETEIDWIRANFKKVFFVTAGVVGCVVLALAVLARPLVLFMYGEDYVNTVTLMRILLISAFFNSGIRFTVANIFAAMGEIKYNLVISGLGTALLLILDFITIPSYGAYGVAAANCIVYAMMGIVLLIVFLRKYFRDVNIQ